MEISIDTSQIQILEDFFQGLSAIDQRKIFISGFRKAAAPLVSAAKATAPRRTGNLIRSIGTIEIPREIAIIVGAKTSGSAKGWYGHIVESGTKERFRRKKGGAPAGRVIGTHFFENAYNATEQQIFNSIEQEWYNAIDSNIVRINKRMKK